MLSNKMHACQWALYRVSQEHSLSAQVRFHVVLGASVLFVRMA